MESPPGSCSGRTGRSRCSWHPVERLSPPEKLFSPPWRLSEAIRRWISYIEITQSFVPFCDTDNKMMLHNKSKRDFPSRRTSRRLRRARTRGRRSRTASGCRPRRRARGTLTQTFLKRMNGYFESTKFCPGNNKGRVPTTKWRGQRGQKRRDQAAQNWRRKRDQRKSEERQEDFQEPFQSWQNSEFAPQFPLQIFWHTFSLEGTSVILMETEERNCATAKSACHQLLFQRHKKRWKYGGENKPRKRTNTFFCSKIYHDWYVYLADGCWNIVRRKDWICKKWRV